MNYYEDYADYAETNDTYYTVSREKKHKRKTNSYKPNVKKLFGAMVDDEYDSIREYTEEEEYRR